VKQQKLVIAGDVVEYMGGFYNHGDKT